MFAAHFFYLLNIPYDIQINSIDDQRIEIKRKFIHQWGSHHSNSLRSLFLLCAKDKILNELLDTLPKRFLPLMENVNKNQLPTPLPKQQQKGQQPQVETEAEAEEELVNHEGNQYQ